MGKDGASPPLFHLAEEDSDDFLIAAHDIKGFFVNADCTETDNIVISGFAKKSIRANKKVSDVELRVINPTQDVIGLYYIGRMGLCGAVRYEDDVDDQDFIATFYGHCLPFPEAGAIWRRWAMDLPIAEGEWATYPVEAHRSWLHVVQQCWFTTGHFAKRYGTKKLGYIDGRKIHSGSGFYCALGESINGPGGYFGSTLDGLADCLTNSDIAKKPFSLVWEDFYNSAERMGSSLAMSLVGILQEFGVEVTLRSTPKL